MAQRADRTDAQDSGQIVIGWLAKVIVGLLVVGLVLFEVVGVLVARGTAADTASKAAQEAGFTYRDSRDVRRAEQTARSFVEKEGGEFISFSVDTRDRTATVTVRRVAKTFFIHRIGALKKYTIATSTQSSPLPG